MAKPSEEKAAKNTDREIWRRIPDDYYSPSIHVTKDGGIGINVGGLVHVRSIEKWHSMVSTIAADRQQIENLKLDLHIANRALEIDPATVDLRKRIAELEKQAEIKDTLAEGVMTLAEVYEQLEDVKAENRRLRDILKRISAFMFGLTRWILFEKDAQHWIAEIQQALRPQGEEPCEK